MTTQRTTLAVPGAGAAPLPAAARQRFNGVTAAARGQLIVSLSFREDFLPYTYSSKRWLAHKFMAIPRALWSGICLTITHLCLAIFHSHGLFLGSSLPARSQLYCAARDLQEAAGWITLLFHHRTGHYMIESAQQHRSYYNRAYRTYQQQTAGPVQPNHSTGVPLQGRLPPRPYPMKPRAQAPQGAPSAVSAAAASSAPTGLPAASALSAAMQRYLPGNEAGLLSPRDIRLSTSDLPSTGGGALAPSGALNAALTDLQAQQAAASARS